ncbi:hypothetical protein Bbelb_035670 [Branchiostoma belcheri]|nr:hypothetical protein Bbelb_035670 [Branchiostoma belcheri]
MDFNDADEGYESGDEVYMFVQEEDGDVDSGYESRDEWDTPEEDFWEEDEDAAAERESGLASPSVAVQPLPAPVISRCPFGEESVPGGRVARNDMADSLSRLQDGDVDSGYESRDEWDTPEEDFWERRTRLTILRAAISKIHRLQYTLKTPTLHKFNWEQPAQKDQQIEDIERRLATPMLVNIRSCAALDTWRGHIKMQLSDIKVQKSVTKAYKLQNLLIEKRRPPKTCNNTVGKQHMSMSDMDMTELFRKVLLGGFLHTSEEKQKQNKDLEGPKEFFIHVRDKILQLPAHHKNEDL